jgi:hypothetical protein
MRDPYDDALDLVDHLRLHTDICRLEMMYVIDPDWPGENYPTRSELAVALSMALHGARMKWKFKLATA